MESAQSSLFNVSIDFGTSHLFFPHIIHWILAILFAFILVLKVLPFLAAVRRGERTLPIIGEPMHVGLFIGTLVLIAAYFYLMGVIGELFPYTGLGFLFTSIVFVFLMSLMFMGRKSRRKVITALVNAIVAPTLAWFILGKLFYITLP